MSVLQSFVIAFAMFSRIPMPRVDWNAKSMRWSMAFFPFVGVVIGGVVLVWNQVAIWLAFGAFLRAAGFALLPVLITGGIHMDGFCDTVDALASHADAEKKQAILKDPHAGAFAVIAVVMYLMGLAALASDMASDFRTVTAFACIFVLSRCLSGLGMMLFPCAKDSSLARTFAEAASKKTVATWLASMAVLLIVLLVVLAGVAGLVAAVCALLVFWLYRTWLIGQFGGLSGDLAGWFLQMCELAALAGLVFAGKIVAIV